MSSNSDVSDLVRRVAGPLAVVGAGALAAVGGILAWNALENAAVQKRLRKCANKMIKVDGVEFNVKEQGQGEYTVVLDAGLGMSSACWTWVQEKVSKNTRVISFDRPGLGCSPPKPGPWLRRVDGIVDDMHRVLSAIGAKEKLVLVGHSCSGMDCRLFCHRFPDQVVGMVLVDTAHEGQIKQAQGSSIYNTYPSAEATQEKLRRLSYLWKTGLMRMMFVASSPWFRDASFRLPFLNLIKRALDAVGRAAADQVRSQIKMIGPHLPKSIYQRYVDETFNHHAMAAMVSEHGSQRESMEFMSGLDLMKPAVLGSRPLIVVSRDPFRGAGGRLYPNAKGDPGREAMHEAFQRDQAVLSLKSERRVIGGAGHGSLLFVEQDAEHTAKAILDVVRMLKNSPK